MSTPIQRLERVFRVILEEANSNKAFAGELVEALRQTPPGAPPRDQTRPPPRRNRRPPSAINPIEIVAQGEATLRTALAPLDLEQLKDIVAEHGMDTRKLAMKWKDRARVEDLIVTFAKDRVAKGSVFRTS